MDIVVTIPKNKLKEVMEEESYIKSLSKEEKERYTYYWTTSRLPKEKPNRIYFVWDNAIRAFHYCTNMVDAGYDFSETFPPRDYTKPCFLLDTIIHEVEPIIKMKSFRGWRYFTVDLILKNDPSWLLREY